MKRLLLAIGILTALSASPATAATLCVGTSAGCFSTIQAAIGAAHDGDTITIARGTFAGGITVNKSLRLQGAGADQTVISGGGPVLNIGRALDNAGLNVSVDGVTITGGLNTSVPDRAVTFGGGITIPVEQLDHPPFNGTGATVSISNSVITGNTVRSSAVIPPGFCGPRACAFNSGGGIDNGGNLTLTNTRVTDNTAGSSTTGSSPASDGGAGGIRNHFASTLVLRHSVVSGNHVVTDGDIANHASAGGIGNDGGPVDIADSVVNDNTVEYRGSLDVEAMAGFGGGLVLDQCDCQPPQPATLRNTLVNGNRVTAVNTNPNATPAGYGGGLVAFTPTLLDNVSLSGNSVHVVGASVAGGDGGGMENDAPVTMRGGIVAHNSVVVDAPNGSIGGGGGIEMFADLTLERTLVFANSVQATGKPGPLPFPGQVSSGFGGGIANNGFGFSSGTLTMTDVVVVANGLVARSGFVVRGGGVYSDGPVVRTRTVIAGNSPDQCVGC